MARVKSWLWDLFDVLVAELAFHTPPHRKEK
jgi:hypothetical protein